MGVHCSPQPLVASGPGAHGVSLLGWLPVSQLLAQAPHLLEFREDKAMPPLAGSCGSFSLVPLALRTDLSCTEEVRQWLGLCPPESVATLQCVPQALPYPLQEVPAGQALAHVVGSPELCVCPCHPPADCSSLLVETEEGFKDRMWQQFVIPTPVIPGL